MEDYRVSLKEENEEIYVYLQQKDTKVREQFCIYEEKGRGGSCIVYEAYLCKEGEKQRPVLVKEFYPMHLSHYLRRNDTNHALQLIEELEAEENSAEIRKVLDGEKQSFLDMCQKQNVFYTQNAKKSADEMVEIQGIYTLGESCYVLMKAASGCSWDKIEYESLSQMLETTISVLEELENYHHAQLLHGDIKPANIYIFRKTRQHVCILDFGSVQKLFDGALTGKESLSYSIQYAAPELLETEDTEGIDRIDYFSCVTAKADLYSVAAILYEKITGEYRNQDLPDDIFQKQMDEKMTEIFRKQKHLWLKDVPGTVAAELKLFFGVMLSVNQDKRYELPEMLQRLRVIFHHAEPSKFKLSPECKPMHPTADFIGRKQELKKLEKLLKKKHQALYILGEGGLGKSELALQLAWKLREEFDFYRVSFSEDLEQTILHMQTEPPFFDKKDWESRENAPYSDSRMVSAKDLYYWNLKCLRGYGPTSVLIIDNFDMTMEQKQAVLHSSAYADLMQLEMKIIFTSRENPIDAESDVCVNLDAMSEQELFQMMCIHYKGAKEKETMYELIRAAERNTLIVKQMAKVMEQSWGDLTPEKLLSSFRETSSFEQAALRDGKHLYYENGLSENAKRFVCGNKKELHKQESQIYHHISKLFNLSVLDERSKYIMAQTILFPTGGMSANMYLKCHSELEQDKIRLLELSGWVKKTSDNLLMVHSLIQEVCKKELPQKEKACAAFLKTYYEQYAKLPSKEWMNQRFQRMEIAFHAADNLSDPSGAYAEKAGDMSYQEGRYARALEYYQSFWMRFISSNPNPNTLEAMKAMDKVANSAYGMGDFANAIYYESSGLQIAEKELGEKCTVLLPYYINMGNMYKAYDDYQNAGKYYSIALEMYEEKKVRDKFQQAVLYMNCSKLCERTGNYENAWVFGNKAMELYKELPDIPPIYPASMLVTFGILCSHMHKYEQALEHYERAIAIYEIILGKEHPTTAGCYNNKGICLTQLKRYGEALESLETAYKTQEEVLGKYHPSTANTYHSIAMLHYQTKDYNTAMIWCEKAKEIREKLYGINSSMATGSYMLYHQILEAMQLQ
uniref:tetratricopeptide repeat protein n=1 Tax=Agathobacter sp. TaxID=2021311 RepID=UPI0040573C9E